MTINAFAPGIEKSKVNFMLPLHSIWVVTFIHVVSRTCILSLTFHYFFFQNLKKILQSYLVMSAREMSVCIV